MLDAISATQVAMLHDQLLLQSISQNISNMQTPGYKRQTIDTLDCDQGFRETMQSLSQQMHISIQDTQGSMIQTKHPNDMALAGPGYFEVQTDKGIFYTRRGDFHVNGQGELATATGALLLGNGGTISIEGNNFKVDKSGAVFIDQIKTDQLKIVQFENPKHLNYLGEGLYESQQPASPVNGETHLLQGELEQSNVKSIDEMMDLIKTSRHFEAAQRIMRTADGLLATAISQLGEGNV